MLLDFIYKCVLRIFLFEWCVVFGINLEVDVGVKSWEMGCFMFF